MMINWFKIGTLVCLFFLTAPAYSQAIYGTSGLLRMPTADMLERGTVMIGENHLSQYATQPKRDGYDTHNYYLNATLLPWLEIGYTMTFFSRKKQHWSYPEQDRSFHVKVRLVKEGTWKEWMPAVAVGANDPLTHHEGQDAGFSQTEKDANYLRRFFLVLSKHVEFEHIGDLGVHAAVLAARAAKDKDHYTRPGIGANFQFNTPGNTFAQKALNGLELLAEYDARTVNAGVHYGLFKNVVNIYVEANQLQYLSGGVQFRIRVYK